MSRIPGQNGVAVSESCSLLEKRFATPNEVDAALITLYMQFSKEISFATLNSFERMILKRQLRSLLPKIEEVGWNFSQYIKFVNHWFGQCISTNNLICWFFLSRKPREDRIFILDAFLDYMKKFRTAQAHPNSPEAITHQFYRTFPQQRRFTYKGFALVYGRIERLVSNGAPLSLLKNRINATPPEFGDKPFWDILEGKFCRFTGGWTGELQCNQQNNQTWTL